MTTTNVSDDANIVHVGIELNQTNTSDDTIANCAKRDPKKYLKRAIPDRMTQATYLYRDMNIWSQDANAIGFEEVPATLTPGTIVGFDIDPA